MYRSSQLLMIIIVGIFLFIGCAGTKEYKTGIGLAEKQDYEQALNYFEQAVAADPDNEKYSKALTDVKDKLITKYVHTGEDVFASASPLSEKVLEKAKNYLTRSQALNASHPLVRKFSARIVSERKNFLNQMETLYLQANRNIFTHQWEKAFNNLSQIQARHSQYKKTVQLLSEVKTRGSQTYYKQARVKFQSQKYDDTIKLSILALRLLPDFAPTRQLLQRAENAQQKREHMVNARDAFRSKDWNRTLDLYERALALDPDDLKLSSQIGKLRQNIQKLYERSIRTELQRGLLLKAIEDYKKAEKYFHGYPGLAYELAQKVKNTADGLKKKGNLGSAWFWYDQATKLNENDFDSNFAMQDLEEKLLERVQKSLAIFDFKSPGHISGAGISVTGELISYLSQNLTPDVRILERENLRTLVEEMALSQTGMVSEASAKKVGRLYGVDMAVMGSVSAFNVDSSVTQSQRTAPYSRQVMVPNPNYDPNWRQKMGQPGNVTGALVYGMYSAVAQPDQRMIPEMKTFHASYTIGHHRKTVNISLSYRIVDIETGLYMKTKTIKERKQYKDDTHPGVPQANIWADPLNIPGDGEILRMHTEKVMRQLGYDVVLAFQHLEKKYFKEGETYQSRRQTLRAAEKFVDAIFDERLKNTNTKVSKDARKMLWKIFLTYRFQ